MVENLNRPVKFIKSRRVQIFGIDLEKDKLHMRSALLISTIFCLFQLSAAESELQYSDQIYEKDFRAVKFYQAGSGFNFPIINLSGGDALMLEFDHMKSEMDYFQYTLIHCNADWTPSGLQKTQSINGTGFEDFPNPSFSTGSLVQYTHYAVQLPGIQTQPKVAGNFLLVVYRNYNENDIILSRRLMVLNTQGNVEMNIQQSMQVAQRSTHQEVDFTFELTTDYFIPNPYTDLKTVIMRNAEWNSAITGLPPQFISGKKFDYNYQTGNQFEGLNEYRYFDIRSYRLSAANVKQRFNVSNQKHIILIPEQTRRFDRYFNWQDYNGRYLIFNKDIPIPGGGSTESDYCYVHFTLKHSEDLKGKRVYVYGELSDWRLQSDFRMYYNPESMSYEGVIPLKQAYYNYQFAVEDIETGEVDYRFFEGSHSETENNYMVLMYHKNQTMGYDELIGYGLKNSRSTK